MGWSVWGRYTEILCYMHLCMQILVMWGLCVSAFLGGMDGWMDVLVYWSGRGGVMMGDAGVFGRELL